VDLKTTTKNTGVEKRLGYVLKYSIILKRGWTTAQIINIIEETYMVI